MSERDKTTVWFIALMLGVFAVLLCLALKG